MFARAVRVQYQSADRWLRYQRRNDVKPDEDFVPDKFCNCTSYVLVYTGTDTGTRTTRENSVLCRSSPEYRYHNSQRHTPSVSCEGVLISTSGPPVTMSSDRTQNPIHRQTAISHTFVNTQVLVLEYVVSAFYFLQMERSSDLRRHHVPGDNDATFF